MGACVKNCKNKVNVVVVVVVVVEAAVSNPNKTGTFFPIFFSLTYVFLFDIYLKTAFTFPMGACVK